MITTILRNCARHDLEAAYQYAAHHLHVPTSELTDTVAVAYVCQHFEQGTYSGWDGFLEMRGSDQVVKHRLAVILVNGDFRIHGDGCRDIPRDAAQSDAGAWYIEVATRHQANVECWGDVSSDNFEESTPEWHAECDKNAAMASRFLPCVPAALK